MSDPVTVEIEYDPEQKRLQVEYTQAEPVRVLGALEAVKARVLGQMKEAGQERQIARVEPHLPSPAEVRANGE